MSVDRKTVVHVDTDALRAELTAWVKERPEAVAISLLNSHASSEHKDLVADVVRETLGSEVTIIRSSDVLREVGEYERTVTTCTKAVVKPVVRTYLSSLQDLLAEDGDIIRILKSGGGLTSLSLAGQLPVNILMSGPAGGVQGVANVVTRNTPCCSGGVQHGHWQRDALGLETGVASSAFAWSWDARVHKKRTSG